MFWCYTYAIKRKENKKFSQPSERRCSLWWNCLNYWRSLVKVLPRDAKWKSCSMRTWNNHSSRWLFCNIISLARYADSWPLPWRRSVFRPGRSGGPAFHQAEPRLAMRKRPASVDRTWSRCWRGAWTGRNSKGTAVQRSRRQPSIRCTERSLYWLAAFPAVSV